MNKELANIYVNSIYSSMQTNFNEIKVSEKNEEKEYSDKLFSDDCYIRLAMSLPNIRKLYSNIRNELSKYSLLRMEKTNSFDNFYFKKKLVLRIRVYYDHLLMMFMVDKKKVAFHDYSNLHEYLGSSFLPTNVYCDITEKNIDLYKYLLSMVIKKYKLVRIKKRVSTYNQNKEVIDYEKEVNLNSQEIMELLGYKELVREKTTHKEASSLPDGLSYNCVALIPGKVYKRINEHVITVGECSHAFKEKYPVTLEFLKDIGLAKEESNYLKVVETGGCKCSINVVANEYTLDAIKMLLITGGNLYKIVSKD